MTMHEVAGVLTGRGLAMHSGKPTHVLSLLTSLRGDLVANHGDWKGAGFHAIAVYRFGAWAKDQTPFIRKLTGVVYRFLFYFVRNVYSIELPRSAPIGRRLRIPHPVGIVVSYAAQIGDDCMIRQNVTIGQFNRGRERRPPYAPRIGNNVEVGAGAVVVGGITIGEGARIGPNAIVMTDIPPGGSAFASPAKVLQSLNASDAQRSGRVSE